MKPLIDFIVNALLVRMGVAFLIVCGGIGILVLAQRAGHAWALVIVLPVTALAVYHWLKRIDNAGSGE